MELNKKTAMKVDKHKLKQLRLGKSWSQEKLAAQAEITLRTVQRIESDGYSSLRSLESLAKVLESEPSELIVESKVNLSQCSLYFTGRYDLWLILVGVIASSLFIQVYGAFMGLALPVVIMLSYLPLCFISLLILATQFPLEKYRVGVYLGIFAICLLYGPAVPFLLNKVTMMVLCSIMFECSLKGGDFFRAKAIGI